jgi:syntaxin-binding protein 1
MALKMFRVKANGIVPPDPNYPNSLRTTRASWSGQTRAKTEVSKPQKQETRDLRRNGPRIILFCLGGMSYSEVRSAYETSRQTQREVIMGIEN